MQNNNSREISQKKILRHLEADKWRPEDKLFSDLEKEVRSFRVSEFRNGVLHLEVKGLLEIDPSPPQPDRKEASARRFTSWYRLTDRGADYMRRHRV